MAGDNQRFGRGFHNRCDRRMVRLIGIEECKKRARVDGVAGSLDPPVGGRVQQSTTLDQNWDNGKTVK
jgi:hypothetical protein